MLWLLSHYDFRLLSTLNSQKNGRYGFQDSNDSELLGLSSELGEWQVRMQVAVLYE